MGAWEDRRMEKITVYGLPINPLSALEQLRGASFCVSYGTRDKLTTQLDDAIRLVGANGILLVDNGAFSLYRKGGSTMSTEYQEGFEAWAGDILARCPQAVAVIPDVIGGTEEQNREMILESLLPWDRAMPIWHLDESIPHLLWMCESFGWVGFGSAGKYWKPGTPEWHARMREAFDALDAWERDSNGAYIRPRLHLMRAQSLAHLYPFDSADSCNVAMNHGRYRKSGGATWIADFAARIDARIQASAGPAAEHQIKRPRPGGRASDQAAPARRPSIRSSGPCSTTSPPPRRGPSSTS